MLCGGDNGQPIYNIYTPSRFSAEKKLKVIIQKEAVLEIINSEDSVSVLTDIGCYNWVNPRKKPHGIRCDKAIVDEQCTIMEYHRIILPAIWGNEENVEFF